MFRVCLWEIQGKIVRKLTNEIPLFMILVKINDFF